MEIFDQAALIWALITGIYLLLLKFIPPLQDFTSPLDILYPFGIYLLLRLRLSYSIALAISYSIGAILVNSIYMTGKSATDITVVIHSQLLAHILALPSAIQMHSYQRGTFKAYLDQKDAHEMANYLVNIDVLTKSMTRLYFMEAAADEFLRAKRYEMTLSLLVLDLDHFKKINDSYGHTAGDQVLQRFAAVVLEQKRAQDIFGRLGGEEFGLLLPNTNLMNAKVVAERIKQSWASSLVDIESYMIQSTVSIGACEIDPMDSSFHAMFHRADGMLYKAKRRGRNRVAFQ